MRILVFLHGTTIMHPTGAGVPRAERVAQVRAGAAGVSDFDRYVPVGGAVAKLRRWGRTADLVYLSSHRDPRAVAADTRVLRRHGFPDAPVEYRHEGEDYVDVVARLAPDVLVEDDCESIGGAPEMISPALPLGHGIACAVVPEFGGIDHLPDAVDALARRPR